MVECMVTQVFIYINCFTSYLACVCSKVDGDGISLPRSLFFHGKVSVGVTDDGSRS